MGDKSLTDIRASVAANNLAWLQRELDTEVDDVRHQTLERLLAIELRRLEKKSKP
jgi:hypothetical protein